MPDGTGQVQKEPPGGRQTEADDHGVGRSRGGWTTKIHLPANKARMVRPLSLLSALTGLFETSWRAALPMHLSGRVPSFLSPIHRRIIEQLATGVTNAIIAELLGVSRRTLSRQLEQLNSRAGSVTRFQMALHAARNGWI
ncbi:helix-turn-helix domain-containing protein [Streptomyces goshikiensis]|uniref:helix-turn-helix domain-containing protein n=1 Tax=Streptomyces goshikiensis TaxID=1942 RepID=UPI00379BDB95